MNATNTSLIISQHWFRQWLGAIRQQAITWANVDLDPCRHMTSLGHNELKQNMSWRHVNSFPWHWKTARLPGHMPIKSDLLHLTGKLWITLYFFSVWSRTPTMSSSWPPWLLVMLPRVPRNPSIWVSSRWEETFYPNICPWFCYASAFRRRRHYVFGLSVRPSEAWNTLFWPVHGSIGPPDQP